MFEILILLALIPVWELWPGPRGGLVPEPPQGPTPERLSPLPLPAAGGPRVSLRGGIVANAVIGRFVFPARPVSVGMAGLAAGQLRGRDGGSQGCMVRRGAELPCSCPELLSSTPETHQALAQTSL